MLTSRETSELAQISNVQTVPAEAVPRSSVSETPSPQPERSVSQPPQQARRSRPTARAGDEDAGGSVLRSGSVVPDLKLRDVKKIYVEIAGSDELRSSLVERLGSSGVVAATGAEEADAALKIVVSRAGASAQLVNARGTVLWSSRRYSGDTNKVVSELVKDLLSAIEN